MAIDSIGAINDTTPALAATQTFPPEQIQEFDHHLRHAAAPTDTSQLPRYASNLHGDIQSGTEGACTVRGAHQLERRRELIEQYGGEANLQKHRRELQERYDSIRDDPHQGKYALALRGQIDAIDHTLYPNTAFARSGLSSSEQAYIIAEEEKRLRSANNLAMAVGGPVFTGAGAIGRVMGASERQVSALMEVNVAVVSTATMARALKPARNTPQSVAGQRIAETPVKPVAKPQANAAQTTAPTPQAVPQTPSNTASTRTGPAPANTAPATTPSQVGAPQPTPPSQPSSATLTVNDFPPVATQVSQKQLRHVLGRPEYRGGGYLNSVDDANAVLKAYHSGNAVILGKSAQGFPVIRVDHIAGTNVNLSAGFQNQPTNVFMIKGTQSPSVVPMNPNWKP